MGKLYSAENFPFSKQIVHCTSVIAIVPFHKDFSPSGEQLDLRKLAHEL